MKTTSVTLPMSLVIETMSINTATHLEPYLVGLLSGDLVETKASDSVELQSIPPTSNQLAVMASSKLIL